ncbi:MAG TPA: zinc-binding dehydrogenase, partial [Candidatus Acidoferrum sp.]|nr:zinc-binding dehydrogenase [Candidatus Acidoferrum sp.]
GGEGAGKWLGMGRQLRATMLSPFVRQRLVMFITSPRSADLEVLTELIEAGKIVPAVERTYPLANAGEAMRTLEDGRVRGKLTITI